jgi:adenylyltransferase/sulfurtransferase
MPGLRNDDVPKCAVEGVHPAALGLITAIQVFEAVRVLTGKEPTLLNQLLYVDLPEMKFHKIRIEKSEECPVCGNKPKGSPMILKDNYFEETCARDGRSNFIISPTERVEINLDKLLEVLNQRAYHIRTSSDFGITFDHSDEITASIVKSGIMIIQTSPHLKGSPREQASDIFRSILIDGLGLSPDIAPKT